MKGKPQRSHLRTFIATLVTFTASCVFHLWPYLMCKRNVHFALLYGTYFVVQGLLCAIEKLVFGRARVPRLFLFGAILLPMPLLSIPLFDAWEGFCFFDTGFKSCFA